MSLMFGILTNRALGAEGRGELAALMIFPAMLTGASALQWDRLIISQINNDWNCGYKLKSQIVSIAIVNGTLGAAVASVLAFNSDFTITDAFTVTLYSLVTIPCALTSQYANAYLVARRCSSQLYRNRLLLPAVMLSLLVLCLASNNVTVAILTIIPMISWALTFAYIISRCSLRIHISGEAFKFSGKLLKDWRNVVGQAADNVALQVDVFIVLATMPLGFTGAYVFFKMIDMPFKVITFAIANARPALLLRGKRLDKKNFFRFLIMIIVVALLGLSVPLPVYDTVVKTVVGESFLAHTYLIKNLIIVFAITAVANYACSVLIHQGNAVKLNKIQVIDCTLRAGLVFILTSYLGSVGLISSLIIANFTKLLLTFREILRV